MISKLYCFVDESDQDTRGTFFVVSVVVAMVDPAEMDVVQGDPMIRLADSFAGMARQAHEGDKVYQELVRRLEKVGLLTKI